MSRRLTKAAKLISVGARYKHYKGNLYIILGLGLFETNNEACVIYQAEYGNKITFIRPVKNWIEEVELDNKLVKRFAKVK